MAFCLEAYSAMKLKQFILLLLCLAPFASLVGQEFEVNGINYKLTQKRTGKGMIAYVTGSKSTEPNVIIPNKVLYNGKFFVVVGIEEYAFEYCSSLTSINLPKSLKEIGEGAFFNCENLTSINIPNSVTHIGDAAFAARNSGLQILKIDKATPNIGSAAFSSVNLNSISVSKNNRRYMVKDGVLFNKEQDTLFRYPAQKTDTLYNIPNGVKEIMPGAFTACAHLKSVTIPASMSKIGERAFPACHSLERLTIPSNIKSIGERAFFDCDNLKYIDLPNTIERIGAGAFQYCESLTLLNLPNSITKIEEGVFASSGIVSIEIPNSVVEIERSAFEECVSLENIVLPNSLQYIGVSAFFACSQLQSVTIPNTLKEIEYGAFQGCRSLENIVLPDSLQYIAYGLFFGSGIKKLIIPKRVKSICPGCECETGCNFFSRHIEEITVLWDNPSDVLIGGIYDRLDGGGRIILRVSKGSKELYEADKRWRRFIIVESGID